MAKALQLDKMDSVEPPTAESIDGHAWGEYVRQARERWDVVTRSWGVFQRNSSELMGLLATAETNARYSLMLMTDLELIPGEQAIFWAQFDQRLHNLLASATSLVDHTRRLISYYEHEPEFTENFRRRNDEVAESDVALFLRRLRNYLLHFGVAPTMQTLHFGGPAGQQTDWKFEVQLSGTSLLRWKGWNSQNRSYIKSFDQGLHVRVLVEEYFTKMSDLYQWTTGQYSILHQPGVPPRHLMS